MSLITIHLAFTKLFVKKSMQAGCLRSRATRQKRLKTSLFLFVSVFRLYGRLIEIVNGQSPTGRFINQAACADFVADNYTLPLN